MNDHQVKPEAIAYLREVLSTLENYGGRKLKIEVSRLDDSELLFHVGYELQRLAMLSATSGSTDKKDKSW